jgi:hypothetical protein
MSPHGHTTRPSASNLNPAPGQPPTPNAVTTQLAGFGTFSVYNLAGTLNLIIDVNGYYTNSSLAKLAAQQPFAVTTELTNQVGLTTTPTDYVTVTVTAPGTEVAPVWRTPTLRA